MYISFFKFEDKITALEFNQIIDDICKAVKLGKSTINSNEETKIQEIILQMVHYIIIIDRSVDLAALFEEGKVSK